MDPRTGYPADAGLLSVTVVSENGMLADALSTSLFIMGLSDASAYWKTHGAEEGKSFELILVDTAGTVYATEGLEGLIEMQNSSESPEIIRRGA